MEIENIINAIINIPKKYHELKNISFVSLLRNTGYFELFDEINSNEIKEQLDKHPEWVEQWLNYSDDKRTSSGWYFTKNETGKYIVGFYPSKKFKTLGFADITEACSVFIKMEIEGVRTRTR